MDHLVSQQAPLPNEDHEWETIRVLLLQFLETEANSEPMSNDALAHKFARLGYDRV